MRIFKGLYGKVKITFIPAVHSSTVMVPDGGADKDIHGGCHFTKLREMKLGESLVL